MCEGLDWGGAGAGCRGRKKGCKKAANAPVCSTIQKATQKKEGINGDWEQGACRCSPQVRSCTHARTSDMTKRD